MNDDFMALDAVHISSKTGGGKPLNKHFHFESICIVPHARTIRKAREQVKMMVTTGFSTHWIRSYLKKWALWWARTVESWQYEELLNCFINTCWQLPLAAIAEGLRQHHYATLRDGSLILGQDLGIA